MKNIKLVVEYEGTNFSGWQVQPGLRTVEGELKKALDRATGEDVNIIGAGRTDKKVHSLGQVVNFHTETDIPGENYKRLMDYLLPGDISIKDSCEVDEKFHARFDAKKRQYKYLVYNRELPNAIYRNFSYHFPYYLSIENMKKGAEYLIGTHDFTSFKLTEDIEVNPIRTIEEIGIKKYGDFIEFRIRGNAFLHNMVRIIVGTLLFIGTGKMEAKEMEEILRAKDRTKAGITAGAEGLYLEKVFY